MANFSIAPVGLGSEERRLLDTVIELAAGIEVGDWTVQPDIEQADVAFISLDSPQGSESFQQRQWHLDGQLLVLKSGDDTHIWQTNAEMPKHSGYTYYTQLLHQLENILIRRRVEGIRPASRSSVPENKPEKPVLEAALSDDDIFPESALWDKNAGSHRDLNARMENDDDLGEQDEKLLESLAVEDFFTPAEITEPRKPALSNVVSFQRPEASRNLPTTALPHDSDYPVVPLLETLSGFSFDDHGRALSCSEEALEDTPPVAKAPEVEVDLLLDTLGDNVAPRQLIRSVKKFYPATCFLGHLQSILTSGNPAVVSHADYPDIFIHPGLGLFACKEDLNHFQGLYCEPFYEFQVTEMPWKRRSGGQDLPIWILLYEAAYHGADGRLIANASPAEPFILKQLPDLDRVSCLNSNVAKEVLSALDKQPFVFGQLVEQINCCVADLADLLSAWVAAGFVTQANMAPQPGTSPPGPDDPTKQKTGFFVRRRRSLARHPG